MARQATLFLPSTGQKKIVDVGSREADQLFGQGYQLFTEGATPGATSSRPRSSAEIFGGTPPDFERQNQFNQSLMDLLRQYQGLNTADLEKQRRAFQRAQVGRISETTPEELRSLSPDQQQAIRTGKARALESEITSLTDRIAERQSQIANFGNVLQIARGIGQDIFQDEQQRFQFEANVKDQIRDMAFSSEILQSGQMPDIFAREFPELVDAWNSASRVTIENAAASRAKGTGTDRISNYTLSEFIKAGGRREAKPDGGYNFFDADGNPISVQEAANKVPGGNVSDLLESSTALQDQPVDFNQSAPTLEELPFDERLIVSEYQQLYNNAVAKKKEKEINKVWQSIPEWIKAGGYITPK